MTAVLLVAPTPIGQQRAGPAIRYWEFARILSSEQQVTLLVPNDDYPSHSDFRVYSRAEADLESLLAAHQVIVVQGPSLRELPRLAKVLADRQHYLVVDLYDPITLETLEIDPGGEMGQWLHTEYGAVLSEQLRLGDFFLCASERQRDYWLGALAALDRINPDTYDGSEMRRLVDVVPFGLPASPPQPGGPVLKGGLPGIAPADRVILWGGGLWDWLDPLTPIRAMEQVTTHQPTARLVFFEPERQRQTMLKETKLLAIKMKMLGRQVLFAEWLPPQQWGACLLEADVGLAFHPASLETRFSFRTRLLDYIWAGLPIVTAAGDVLSKVVAAHKLGYVVEPGDEEALAEALIRLLSEPDARQSRREVFRQVAEQYQWEQVTLPLVHYCRQPWRAGDSSRSYEERWRMAEADHLQADAAHAKRQLASAEARVRTWAVERSQAIERAERLQAQVADLKGRTGPAPKRSSPTRRLIAWAKKTLRSKKS